MNIAYYFHVKYFYIIFTVISIFISHYTYAQSEEDLIQLAKINDLNLQEINESATKDLENMQSIKKKEVKLSIPVDNEKFGYSFLEFEPSSIVAVDDLPLPNDYIISLNDTLSVVLTGAKKERFDINVKLDGTVLFPELGNIFIAGKRFGDVKNLITELVNESYIGVEVYISIKELSAKKITLVGAINTPGTYLVNPFTTISGAISYGGGVKDFGSLRNITLIKADEEKHVFDLYDLLIKGDRSNDIPIEAGDTILVPGTSNFVKITGEALRPLTYEYINTDKYSDLVEFALGTTNSANFANITSYFIENGLALSKRISLDESIDNTLLTELNIGKLISIPSKEVRVYGTSVQNGSYKINKEKGLGSLINELKFSGEIYPFYFILKQSDQNNLLKESYNLSLSDPSTYDGLILKDNIEIYFFSRTELISNAATSVDIPATYRKNFNLGTKTFNLPISGKISPMEIASFLDINEDLDLDKTVTKKIFDSLEEGFNKKFDSAEIVSVSVPARKVDRFEVEIQGQVYSPGKYIVDSTSTLSELYTLAGGIKKSAFTRGIYISRESIKNREREALESARSLLYDSVLVDKSDLQNQGMQQINVDDLIKLTNNIKVSGRVSGSFESGSEDASSLLLQNGDYIFVPSPPSTISIFGEISNPVTLNFKSSLSYEDYISLAGGFTLYADKSAVYVIKANGESIPLRRGIFQKEIYLEPGDSIIVPRDLDRISTLPLVSVATKIISDIAFAAASLNSLSN